MNILTQLTESDSLRSLQSYIDNNVPIDISSLSRFLSPQWLAGYMGLKKLVEKDYQHGEDAFSLSITNV